MMKTPIVIPFLLAALVGGCSCDSTDPTNELKSSLKVSPLALDFGRVAVGDSASRTFQVSNAGDAPLLVEVASTEAVFTVEPASAQVQPLGSVDFTVTFSPTEIEDASGTVEVVSNGGEATVELTGYGIASLVAVSPASIDFGDVARDRPDTPRDDRKNPVFAGLNITNAGSNEFEVLSIEFVDDGGGVFDGDFADLLGVYAPSERRSGRVTFDPPDLEAHEGTLKITTSSPERPEILVPLRGRGVAPVMVVCSSFPDDPSSEICTPDLPVQGGQLPRYDFGTFQDLESRVGKLVIRNEGNAILDIRTLGTEPRSPDISIYRDEALQEPLPIAGVGPKICPVGVDDESCAATGELVLWVNYRARGSLCCNDGVAECTALVPPGGTCRDVENTDLSIITLITNDPIWPNVTIQSLGRSLIARAEIDTSINVPRYNGEAVDVMVRNTGSVMLTVENIFLSDPADDSCGMPPCDCARSSSPLCQIFGFGELQETTFDLPPDETRRVNVYFRTNEQESFEIELWWSTTDPLLPTAVTNIFVRGLGDRPED